MRPSVEMTASGPFAMGPALAGRSGRRIIPRSNFTPMVGPTGSSGSSSLGAGMSGTQAPSLKKEKDKADAVSAKSNDEDEYSDPDEGVEIVDMENIRHMDWAAPESLHRERHESRKMAVKIKKEMSVKGAQNHFFVQCSCKLQKVSRQMRSWILRKRQLPGK